MFAFFGMPTLASALAMTIRFFLGLAVNTLTTILLGGCDVILCCEDGRVKCRAGASRDVVLEVTEAFDGIFAGKTLVSEGLNSDDCHVRGVLSATPPPRGENCL